MKFALLLLTSSVFFTQDIKNPKNPRYITAIKLEEIHSFSDEEMEFYRTIDTSVSADGKVVVLDRGNSRAIIFKTSGEKIFEFTREGQGPGEFSSSQFSPYATRDYIVFYSPQKLMVYTYKGELISEIKGNFFSKIKIRPQKEFIQFYYCPDQGQKLITARYRYTGELIDEVERGYDDRVNYKSDTGKSWLENYQSVYKKRINFYPFRDVFISYDRIEYRLDLCDVYGKKLKSVYAETKRLPFSEKDLYHASKKDLAGKSKDEIEKLHKFYASANKQLMAVSGGYKAAISRIAGDYDNEYLFVQVNTKEKDKIRLDVFDSDYRYFTQIILTGEGIDYCKIVNKSLLVEYKTDDGYFFKLFKLNFLKK